MFSHVKGMGEIQTEETPKINTFQTMRKEVSGMAVFRIEKTRDYTVMSNHHLRDMSLSLKAKGLLSLMLSLPENWDYTMKGLARICKDGIDSISGGIRELEEHGYLIRERVRGANGQLGSIEYTILEQPKEPTPAQEKPIRENPVQANPTLVTPVQEEPAQLNKEESSNYPSRTDLSSTELSNPIQSNPPTPAGVRIGTDRMENLKEVIRYVSNYEDEFVRMVMDADVRQKNRELAQKKKKLIELQKRIGELDTIFQRIYEDNITGKLSDERFMKMSKGYEDEQHTLQAEADKIQNELQQEEKKSVDVKRFLAIVKKYTDLTELTPEILWEFVDKIIVHAPDKSSGRRLQEIEIIYNHIGEFDHSKVTLWKGNAV